jgi:hypothetical protein
VEHLICAAIAERRLIEFRLHGLRRVAEPHLYGRHKGVLQLLVYQVGGDSRSGGLPYWRRIDLDEISELRMLEERFEAVRLPGGKPQAWDAILAQVN